MRWEDGGNMAQIFFDGEKPILTVMLQCETAETAIGRIRNSLHCGAEGFGLQVETLKPEYHKPDIYRKIFGEMRGKPVYVTNYRYAHNEGKTDEELANGLLELAECGASLCDVMGDLYDKQPDELAVSDMAIQKQMQLIEELHHKETKVLMSSHIYHFTPAERVLEMALEQKRRGVDVVKIVTGADDMNQQIENLRITHLLKQELGIPFLFLSGGVSSIHRRAGMMLGNCMQLCVYEHDALSTFAQPLLSVSKAIRDDLGFM